MQQTYTGDPCGKCRSNTWTVERYHFVCVRCNLVRPWLARGRRRRQRVGRRR